jgi:hypothetical protein
MGRRKAALAGGPDHFLIGKRNLLILFVADQGRVLAVGHPEVDGGEASIQQLASMTLNFLACAGSG